MSNLTRIKNNQIVDSTIIASQKIQAGSITGSLFSSNVTVPGDLLISGNLFVLGTSAYTVIASTNTYVNDPLVTLNNGFAGTNTYDEGLIFNRGSLLNQAFIWNEANKEFRLVGTTEVGTTYGSIAVSNFANLHIGNLTVDYTANVTNINATGFINTTGNISAAVANFGSMALTGFINTSGNISGAVITAATVNASGNVLATVFNGGAVNVSGNVVASTVLAQLVTADDATFGNVAAGFVGNTGTQFTGASINLSGNVLAATVLGQLVTADNATFGNVAAGFIGNTGTAFTGASINLSGNVLAATVGASFLTASTVTVGNISANTIGNAGATITGTTGAFSGNVIGGLAQFAAINNTPIGNATASTGAFTTLSASQNFYANASIATTTQGTGAIVVPNGGISVSGAANIAGAITTAGAAQFNNTLTVGGITTVTDTTNSSDATGTTGALRIAGGASIAKDLWVGGNLYAANIIGVSANIITVQDPLLYLRPDHTFPYDYDIGFYSAFTGTGLTTAGNVYQHTGIIRNELNNTWTFASNLAEPGGGHVVFDADTVYDPIKAGNLELTVTTAATSATTGALIVAGGAGIGGNIFHTGTRLETSASNYIFATTPTTVDAFTAATSISIGAPTGTMSLRNPSILGVTATQALFDTTTTTINFGRTANITMGTPTGITTVQGAANIQATTASTNSATGALRVMGGVGLAGNIFMGGAYLDSSSTNMIMMATPTSANNFSAATTIFYGAAAGDFVIRNPIVSSVQGTLTLFNANVTTLNFAGAATTVVAGATSGVAHLRNANIWVPNATTLDGQQTDINVFTQTATNANVLTRANVILGGNVGITTIQNPTVRLSNASNIWVGAGTLTFANAGVTTLNIGGDATSINIGATTGETNVRNGLDVLGVLYANVAAESTTSANGGLVVRRGAGIGGSLNVANSAAFNTGLTTGTFEIKSSTSGNVALFANLSAGSGTSESVIIGGANTVVQSGVTLKVNSTTSMMLPVGPTAARPSTIFGAGYDVAGMLRFNNTINNMEFYDGTQWQTAGSVFTVISSRQFTGNVAGGFGNVDGTNVTFTLASNATTAGTLVSINGVLQLPTLAYSVSGATMTFTEPPAPGDVIDSRVITTTTTISALTNGSGAVQFIAEDDGASIFTGATGGSVERVQVDTAGDFNLINGTDITYNQTAVNIAANNTPYVIATRSQTSFTSAIFQVSAKRGTGATGNVESYTAQVVTDGAGNAYITTYGVVNNGYTMGGLTANVLAGNVQVYYTGSIASAVVQANVKCFGTYIL